MGATFWIVSLFHCLCARVSIFLVEKVHLKATFKIAHLAFSVENLKLSNEHVFGYIFVFIRVPVIFSFKIFAVTLSLYLIFFASFSFPTVIFPLTIIVECHLHGTPV